MVETTIKLNYFTGTLIITTLKEIIINKCIDLPAYTLELNLLVFVYGKYYGQVLLANQ